MDLIFFFKLFYFPLILITTVRRWAFPLSEQCGFDISPLLLFCIFPDFMVGIYFFVTDNFEMRF